MGLAIVAPAVIIALACLVYIPVLYNGFDLDDHTLIETNQIPKAPNGWYRLCFTTEATDYFPLTWTVVTAVTYEKPLSTCPLSADSLAE